MKRFEFIWICFFGLAISGCNPDCDQLLSIQIDTNVKQSGQEILITSNNPDLLVGKQISFASANATVVADRANYVEELNGVIVEIPQGMQGENIQIMVDDPDCGPNVFSNGLAVYNEDFFANNPIFIPPAPFEIVIPSIPLAFPPLVQNAWISPQDLDYCIWFKFLPVLDEDGDPVLEEVDGMLVSKESRNLDPNASFEYSVEELVCQVNANHLYHDNPVYGVVDKELNFVNFWIDRTEVNGMNLGIEEFEGTFIDIDKAGYREQKTPDCDPGFDPNKYYLILVTSKQTGRQLLLYQQA